MALKRRCPEAGLLHHSDQGCTYASEDYRTRLEQHGITCSMSRRGNCYDNAVMESGFSTVKSEEADRFESFAHAKAVLFDYIEVVYNQRRSHSRLGQISPATFERNKGMDAAGAVDAQNAPTAPWKTAQNAVSHSAHSQPRYSLKNDGTKREQPSQPVHCNGSGPRWQSGCDVCDSLSCRAMAERVVFWRVLESGRTAERACIGKTQARLYWLRGRDLNPRPLGYEPNELPDCSTPRRHYAPNPPLRQPHFGSGRRRPVVSISS
jgi:hypothetical protein